MLDSPTSRARHLCIYGETICQEVQKQAIIADEVVEVDKMKEEDEPDFGEAEVISTNRRGRGRATGHQWPGHSPLETSC